MRSSSVWFSRRSSGRLARFVLPLLVAGCAVAGLGCDDKKKEAPSPEASTPTQTMSDAAASADDAAAMATDAGMATGPDTMTDGGAKHLADCPATAPGATVAIKDVEGGVEVSITGKDAAAASDIKARMAKLIETDKAEIDAGVKHDHNGSGGGGFGHCTVVMRKTKIETADIPNGVKATVKPNDKAELDWLRRETRERDKNAKVAGADGAGTHHMAHCPSAVPGAKTVVKDSKEGVIVTVTGSGDAVKDIRERAKHSADISKLPEPPKVEHNSEGMGGGGLGRCPVVVEGDTIVDTKDIDNGSEITVKAKKDVAALQKEAKLRAASFTGK